MTTDPGVTPSTWRYVATHRLDEAGQDVFEVHELYSIDGELAWTTDPVSAGGESLERLMVDLSRMRDDVADGGVLDLTADPPQMVVAESGEGPAPRRPGPLSRILDAGLELARTELVGRVLDDDERAALDFCDKMGRVRGIAEHEAGGGDEDEIEEPEAGGSVTPADHRAPQAGPVVEAGTGPCQGPVIR